MAEPWQNRHCYQPYALLCAGAYGVPPGLFSRQIDQESGYQPDARSSVGAVGIAQIVPAYHPTVDPTDPVASLNYAAELMQSHYSRYQSWLLALVAYNGGQGAVDAWQRGEPYDESLRYVQAVAPDLLRESD